MLNGDGADLWRSQCLRTVNFVRLDMHSVDNARQRCALAVRHNATPSGRCPRGLGVAGSPLGLVVEMLDLCSRMLFLLAYSGLLLLRCHTSSRGGRSYFIWRGY